jgi:hypothetical protein
VMLWYSECRTSCDISILVQFGGELMVPGVYGAVEMKCVYRVLFSYMIAKGPGLSSNNQSTTWHENIWRSKITFPISDGQARLVNVL